MTEWYEEKFTDSSAWLQDKAEFDAKNKKFGDNIMIDGALEMTVAIVEPTEINGKSFFSVKAAVTDEHATTEVDKTVKTVVACGPESMGRGVRDDIARQFLESAGLSRTEIAALATVSRKEAFAKTVGRKVYAKIGRNDNGYSEVKKWITKSYYDRLVGMGDQRPAEPPPVRENGVATTTEIPKTIF